VRLPLLGLGLEQRQCGAERQAFAAWWDAMVTPEKGGDPTTRQSRRMGTLAAAAATAQTGISKQQVSRCAVCGDAAFH
jgi:hypothetical protein